MLHLEISWLIGWAAVAATSSAAAPAAELLDFVTPGAGWTTAEVARSAVARSPRVAMAQARLRGAAARAEASSADLLPRVDLEARYTRLSAIDNDPLVDLSIDLDAARAGVAQIVDPAARAVLGAQLDQLSGLGGARIEIPQNQAAFSARIAYPVSQLFFELLPARRARAAAAAAARDEVDVARNVAALEAVEALLGHARARSALAVARRALEEAQLNARAARARLDARVGTRPDLLRLEARLADAEGARAEREAEVAASAAALRTLAGIEGAGPVALGQELVTDLPPPFVASGAALVEVAWQRRDELRALERLVEARRAAAEATGGGVWPRLLASARVDLANPNNLYVPPGDRFRESWSVSGVLEWSPDRAWRASREARAAQAELGEALARRAALRDLARVEVSRAEARFGAARVALAASRRGIEAARAGFAAVTEGFRLGVYDATDLIDAELQLQRARLGLIDAGVGLRLRRARLRRAVGEHLWE